MGEVVISNEAEHTRAHKKTWPGTDRAVRMQYEMPFSAKKTKKKIGKLQSGGVIIITRYRVPVDDKIVEVDEKHGDLEGKYVAEIEAKKLETVVNFIPPEWFGEHSDVTAYSRYSNRNPARYG